MPRIPGKHPDAVDLRERRYAVVGGVSEVVPVDLHIRGCPPAPAQLLQGLLALLEAGSHGRTA